MNQIDPEQFKAGQKALWQLGDFPALAPLTRPASERILDAADVKGGDALLDVACGTGNLAIPAAQRGAAVAAVDITPQLLEVAREDAVGAGVAIDFHEGDAEDLPFTDDSFDKVVSVFGVMFAPQQEIAAAELARTCKPGGTVATASWTPDGMNGELFRRIGAHMPPRPAGAPMPFAWGDAEHVRSLFDPAVEWTFTNETAEFEAPSADGFFELMERSLGPVVLARSALEPQGKYDALRSDLRELFDEHNAAGGGAFSARPEYLLAVGRLPD